MAFTWQTIEALGAAYFIQQGYSVLVPFGDSNYYDFIVEKDGDFKRVNVKKAHLDRCTCWRISLPRMRHGGTAMEHPEVDCYLAYLADLQLFIELGGDFFIGAKSKTKVIPKAIVDAWRDQQATKEQD